MTFCTSIMPARQKLYRARFVIGYDQYASPSAK